MTSYTWKKKMKKLQSIEVREVPLYVYFCLYIFNAYFKQFHAFHFVKNYFFY